MSFRFIFAGKQEYVSNQVKIYKDEYFEPS